MAEGQGSAPKTRQEALRQWYTERQGVASILRFNQDGTPTTQLGATYEVAPVWGPGKVRLYWQVRERGRPLGSIYKTSREALDALQRLKGW